MAARLLLKEALPEPALHSAQRHGMHMACSRLCDCADANVAAPAELVLPALVLVCVLQVGPWCIVGEDCVIGDKSSVKRTVMGRNCK